MTYTSKHPPLRYQFGTFDGAYWPTDYCRFEKPVPTSEILDWNQYDPGEAEFWPTGDKPEMTLLFNTDNRICCKEEILSLEKILDHLGGDSVENYLRIRHATRRLCVNLCELPYQALVLLPLHIFVGATLAEVQDQAVADLSVRYRDHRWGGSGTEPSAYLDLYRNDPAWGLETVAFGNKVALLVWPEARRFSDSIPGCK
jgi:hypothetical protein